MNESATNEQSRPIDDVHVQTIVPIGHREAFALFTRDLSAWWPREFSWSGDDNLEDIGMEPQLDGFLYERGPYGLRLDWGRIIVWDPSQGLTFTWQIGADRVPIPDPEHASEVAVSFDAVGPGATRVELTHSHWDRHGPQAGDYRSNMSGAWQYALDRFTEAASDTDRD